MLSVLAGGPGGAGNADGTGAGASFFLPSGVATDSAGSVYVADFVNSTIRKITPEGVVSTLAGAAGMEGTADGTGEAARFSTPWSVAIDSAGNVFVADGQCTIRKITPNGVVSTFAGTAGICASADGTGSAARFNLPSGVASDSSDNVYVADSYNDTIRKITPTGVVTTLAGMAGMTGSTDGTGAAARFSYPFGVATDSAGNVYVTDAGNGVIRKITPAGVVTTLAGTAGTQGSTDGTGAAARFNDPRGVATDSADNVYVADFLNDTIRKITPAGVVSTFAGAAGMSGSTDGTGAAARFYGPTGVAVDGAGNVYVGDADNDTLRKITPAGVVTTMAGLPPEFGSADGTGAVARFGSPSGVATDSAANLYVADYENLTIRKITPAGVVSTLAGTAGKFGSVDGTGAAARFEGPISVTVDNVGNIYVADTFGDANSGTFSCTIRKITTAGVVSTFAGTAGTCGITDGTGAAARFGSPWGLATDSAGNVYVADECVIRKISPAAVVSTLAGAQCGSSDGMGVAVGFNGPHGVAVDGAGNVYVADTGNFTIRRITPAGVVTTLAGMAGLTGSADGVGAAARFDYPTGVAVDAAGDVYVAETHESTIRKVTPAGVVTTIVGRPGQNGFAPGPLPGLLNTPTSVAVFGRTLYTTTNNAIVQVSNVP